MIRVLRFVDAYLAWLFILLFFRLKYLFLPMRKSLIRAPKKILVIRLRALGSSLLTFPMIKQLEDHYGKDVQYDLLATSRNIGVFKNQCYFRQMYNLFSVKGFLKMLLSFKKYDIVIDVEEYFRTSSFFALRTGKVSSGFGNLRTRKIAYTDPVIYNDHQHTILTFLDLLKPLHVKTYAPEAMEPLVYAEKDTVKVDGFLRQFVWNYLVCMHTWWAETAKERAWPIHKRVALIQSMIKKHSDVIIILSGTHFEKKIVQDIIHQLDADQKTHVFDICGMFNLFAFAYLLTKCDLMISNDTGPMHLAAAMWTKTIGLFGPELPRKFGPYPPSRNIWLYKGDGKAFINVHLAQREKDTEYTIDRITVEDVLNEIILDR